MGYNSFENLSVPTHRDVSVIGVTEAGVIIKGSDGHFDKTGPQAQPRPTRWDQREIASDSLNTSNQEGLQISTHSAPLRDTVFET